MVLPLMLPRMLPPEAITDIVEVPLEIVVESTELHRTPVAVDSKYCPEVPVLALAVIVPDIVTLLRVLLVRV